VQLIVHCGAGDIVFSEQPRFVLPGAEQDEGGFVARMPGKVIELRVKVGDTVADGDMVLVLEAMKMEHPMRASEDGVVVEVMVEEGEQVEAGTLLLVVETTSDETASDENDADKTG
jgi:propionyl-CoA carboxylase alpha chain